MFLCANPFTVHMHMHMYGQVRVVKTYVSASENPSPCSRRVDGPAQSRTMADAIVDAHTKEQGRLLRAFHFGQDRPKDEWSSTGPRSLSPFVPCASARIAAVFSAARLTSADVLWDLGCGDGRVLHQAAVQHGCRCVGLEIDRACVDEAKQRAAEQDSQHAEPCNARVV